MGDGLIVPLGISCRVSELVQFLGALPPEVWQNMLRKRRYHGM